MIVPPTLQAADAAIATMAATFPNAMQEENFIKALAAELRNLGFQRYSLSAQHTVAWENIAIGVLNVLHSLPPPSSFTLISIFYCMVPWMRERTLIRLH